MCVGVCVRLCVGDDLGDIIRARQRENDVSLRGGMRECDESREVGMYGREGERDREAISECWNSGFIILLGVCAHMID